MTGEGETQDAAALNRSGILAVQQGRLAQGRSLLEAAAARAPEVVKYRADLAQAQTLAGEEAAAVESYRRCLALDPGFAPAWLNLGILMLRADRIEEAGQAFEQAIAKDGRLAEAHAGLGFVRQRQGRATDAIATLEQAAALAPQDAQVRSNLGGLLLENGAPEKAIESFRQAIVLIPNQASLHTNLAVATHQVEGAAAALAHYDAALELAPGDARALAAKGAALAALGRQAEAARIFDYPALLVSRQLGSGAGDAQLAGFNAALAEVASNHPSLMRERAGKTTRGGGQTGQLLGPASGPIAQWEGLIRGAVEDYFADPGRAAHPFAPRRPASYRITAWATVLDRGGHQDPHHHPSGRLSGVYYVQLPTDGEPGALEFGRPAAEFAAATLPPLARLRPQPGLLVLFPSFFWHRTIPFEGSGRRISIAFDVIAEAPARA